MRRARCHDARPVVLGLLSGVGFLVVFGGILFGCAGRWDLPLFWAYLGIWAAAIVVAVLRGRSGADPRSGCGPAPAARITLTVYGLTLLMARRNWSSPAWTWAGSTGATPCPWPCS